MAFVPNQISAGLTASFTVEHRDYPAADWDVILILRGPSSIDLTATAQGDAHLIEATAADTSGWEPGRYWYSLRASKGSDVQAIEHGQLVITQDLAAVSAGYDGRHHVEKVLEAIEAVIEGRAGKDQDSYRINNRELRRTPVGDLMKLRSQYRNELVQIKQARSGRRKLGRTVKAEFGRGL
jgi:hypothetical protein